MRIEQAKAKTALKNGLAGAAMGLALVSVTVLAMGNAPTKQATFSIEAAKPKAAEFASTTLDGISPREEIADVDVLDLQLD
jgi:hypothetical protein